MSRGTKGAYRKEDRVQLPPELQKELVEKAAAKCGNCQELARHLDVPKSSVHYYLVGRLTMPQSVLDMMTDLAGDEGLRERICSKGVVKDRTWANEYSASIYREMCRDRVRLPTKSDLENDDDLRRKAAALVSYVLAEGSVWIKGNRYDEGIVNITFADHEADLYAHFQSLCRDVFHHEIGPPQMPGNGARAIRGFIYSTFIAQWFVNNGVPTGYKSSQKVHLPEWLIHTDDLQTTRSALQPWCDGEGCVLRGPTNRLVGFSLAQSRHTDLDAAQVPSNLIETSDKGIGIRKMSTMTVHNIPLLDYVLSLSRSEIIGDLEFLCRRLTTNPRTRLSRLHLKNDGFFFFFWEMRFNQKDTLSLMSQGVITQERKLRSILESARNKNH